MKIERHVLELVRAGVIQRSSSQFTSPVILVKKTDGTWRLYANYWHLNAMMIVAKFPVPIV